jgi:hypothetical protein
MQSTPQLKKKFRLDILNTEFDKPKKLMWKLKSSATYIEANSKVTGRFGSKQAKLDKIQVLFSLVENHVGEEDIADMDLDYEEESVDGDSLKSFQNTLAEKANRVCFVIASDLE